MPTEKEIGLAIYLESLNIGVCCLLGIRTQGSSEVIQARSPHFESLFRMRLSGHSVLFPSGFAGVDVPLSSRAEAELADGIPINLRLCAVRLESSVKVRRNLCGERCFLAISAYTPTGCCQDSTKDDL
uniref:Uncharacterized protein n=1 Tax=Schistosoma mansoni TaxID=6183 RepID=G4LYQ4_SCHMA